MANINLALRSRKDTARFSCREARPSIILVILYGVSVSTRGTEHAEWFLRQSELAVIILAVIIKEQI